jgi:hypothetical protein
MSMNTVWVVLVVIVVGTIVSEYLKIGAAIRAKQQVKHDINQLVIDFLIVNQLIDIDALIEKAGGTQKYSEM